MMIYVTRREHFSASHRLYNPGLSEEKNIALYDKCANPNGHGHNYFVEVTVAGELDAESGYVIDLKKLKHVINEKFISKVDHKHLNHDVDFLQGVIPTAENVAIACWNQLAPHITYAKLYSVRIYETEKNFVEYKGE